MDALFAGEQLWQRFGVAAGERSSNRAARRCRARLRAHDPPDHPGGR
jgi:hypothetical protein